MPRIPYPQPEQLDEEARNMMAGIPPLHVFRMLSYSGPALAGFLEFGTRLVNSLKITSGLQVITEIVTVRVAHLSGCAYELAQHERSIAALGVAPEKIAALRRGADQSALSNSERAAVAFTDDIVANVRASDQTLGEMRRYFSDRQVIELILLAGSYRMLAMMIETTGVDIEAQGEVEQLSTDELGRRFRAKLDAKKK